MALNDTLHDIMYAFYKDPSVYSSNWFNGDGVPGVGNPESPRNGDFYVNVANNDIYAFDGTSWTKVGTLGGGGALYVQDNTPDLGTPAPGYPLWLDTDEPDTIIADGSKIGNLLTANQASIETDTTGWESTGGPTVTNTTSVVYAGSAALLITINSTGSAQGARQSDRTPVTPGSVVTVSIRARNITGTRGARVRLLYYDALVGGNYLGTTTMNYSPVSSSSWTLLQDFPVVPAGATYAQVFINVDTGSAGDAVAVDALGLWAGAGGNWAMPGVPIVGLGQRTTHPNTDDVLVQRWDESLGRWQTVHYNSGRRSVSGLVANGWTILRARLIRDGDVCSLSVVNADPAAATSEVMMNLPLGFRPLDDGAMPVNTGQWADTAAPAVARFAANGNVEVRRAGYTGLVQFKWTWITPDPIPTSLPGTLLSPAPA